MFRIELKYGLITGAGICLWIIAEYFLGLHTTQMHLGQYTIYFVVIIPLFTIYFGLKEKRDRHLNGKITINGGIKAGLMISLIAALIISCFLIIYFNYINPQYSELGVAYYKEKLMLSGKTAVEVTQELDSIKRTFSFINQLLFGVIAVMGTGLLISFIMSLYLNKNGIFRKNIIS